MADRPQTTVEYPCKQCGAEVGAGEPDGGLDERFCVRCWREDGSAVQQTNAWTPPGRAAYWLTPEQRERLTISPWWYSRWPWIGFAAGFGFASLLWKVLLP